MDQDSNHDDICNDCFEDSLDPGIRDLVMLLRDHGWETTDSGDGVSKGSSVVIPFPHVYVSLDVTHDLRVSADFIRFCLDDHGYDAWNVEAVYNPKDGEAGVMLTLIDAEAVEGD